MKYKLRTKPKTRQGDPDGQNRERAEWALVALAAFQDTTRTDDGDAFSDLLCDLMHLEDYITGESRRNGGGMTKEDKQEANRHNLEWLKLSNKILRAVPGSPAQRELQEARKAIPQFKNISPQSN